MLQVRSFILAVLLTLCISGNAMAEGFAMTEWSARGLSLAGGMVGRANDPSAIAYNAAGITQLPGFNVMAGASFIAPYGSIVTKQAEPLGGHTTSTKPQIWVPPHAYMTYQINDDFWFGAGFFTRFGLGNTYSENWRGRYGLYTVGLESTSFVPSIAYKINDIFSVSVGVEAMYMSMYQGAKIPSLTRGEDNDVFLEGSGVGFGYHLGVHAKFNEQWSAGLSYKSQVKQTINATAEYDNSGGVIPSGGVLPNGIDTSVHGTIYLPDSIAFGLTYKPIENLSFEVGTVWTRWSSYKNLNMHYDDASGYDSKNEKLWKDGWNFNVSVEYEPYDWLALRAGYWHETAVTNPNTFDYLMPTNGRDVLTLGAGFKWDNWTVDLAYAHLWIHPGDYKHSGATGIKSPAGITSGRSENVGADIYSFSIGYTF